MKARFTIEAGCVVRGQVKRAIEAAAWQRNIQCNIKESKGLLESVLMVTLEGDDETTLRQVYSDTMSMV